MGNFSDREKPNNPNDQNNNSFISDELPSFNFLDVIFHETTPVQTFSNLYAKAEQGDSDVQVMLGVMYFNGDGVKQNIPEAIKWFEKAAEKGEMDAQINLAKIYFLGQGVERDILNAEKWFFKAAIQGDKKSQYNLALLYYNGEDGIPQNHVEARNWFAKSAENGYADAQEMLGYMYYYGEGGEIDFKEAFNWFEKAAEQGKTYAQFKRAWMCYEGEGVEKDLQRAVDLFTLVAKNEQTDKIVPAIENVQAEAQCNLADIYYFGEGNIEKNLDRAFYWYKKSAEQGNEMAQFMLGKMYYYGEGVEENRTIAFMWINESADALFPDALVFLDEHPN